MNIQQFGIVFRENQYCQLKFQIKKSQCRDEKCKEIIQQLMAKNTFLKNHALFIFEKNLVRIQKAVIILNIQPKVDILMQVEFNQKTQHAQFSAQVG
ncbi:unnamed protein product [Paramecium octaurelia]|uniref:Uncharacterized protein n=1 Tax=Paramecium octaurelia TaxID=43137 RepID=A0A8S1X407_PAROT|nr:unnamed protein product [Paramecium octaurelia]